MSSTIENKESDDDFKALVRRANRVEHLWLVNRWAGGIAVIGLVLSFVLPSDGMGIELCFFRRMFDLPCPGCGLTRSVSSISQGHFDKALLYNPFGYAAYVAFILTAVGGLLPTSVRAKILRWHADHPMAWGYAWRAVVFSLAAYGLTRLAFHIYTETPY